MTTMFCVPLIRIMCHIAHCKLLYMVPLLSRKLLHDTNTYFINDKRQQSMRTILQFFTSTNCYKSQGKTIKILTGQTIFSLVGCKICHDYDCKCYVSNFNKYQIGSHTLQAISSKIKTMTKTIISNCLHHIIHNVLV